MKQSGNLTDLARKLTMILLEINFIGIPQHLCRASAK